MLGLAMLIGSAAAAKPQTGFLDRSVVVAGVSYRFQVYVPVDYRPDRSWPVAPFWSLLPRTGG